MKQLVTKTDQVIPRQLNESSQDHIFYHHLAYVIRIIRSLATSMVF